VGYRFYFTIEKQKGIEKQKAQMKKQLAFQLFSAHTGLFQLLRCCEHTKQGHTRTGHHKRDI